jgi:hypothetical protein
MNGKRCRRLFPGLDDATVRSCSPADARESHLAEALTACLLGQAVGVLLILNLAGLIAISMRLFM